MLKNKTFINYLGFLGVLSFISYAIAVFFSPLAYPSYDWLSQAVSDLSADGAPSLGLWKILSTFYSTFNLASMLVVSIVAYNKNINKILKSGIYTYTVMNVISSIGYGLFPLSEEGNKFQDIMHVYVVTVLVVVLSIVGLILCIIGGVKKRGSKLIFIGAILCLSFMTLGAIGTGVLPKEIFGLFERFSTLSAVLFVAILGIWVFLTDVKLSKE